jgi:hypothetical protein
MKGGTGKEQKTLVQFSLSSYSGREAKDRKRKDRNNESATKWFLTFLIFFPLFFSMSSSTIPCRHILIRMAYEPKIKDKNLVLFFQNAPDLKENDWI